MRNERFSRFVEEALRQRLDGFDGRRASRARRTRQIAGLEDDMERIVA